MFCCIYPLLLKSPDGEYIGILKNEITYGVCTVCSLLYWTSYPVITGQKLCVMLIEEHVLVWMHKQTLPSRYIYIYPTKSDYAEWTRFFKNFLNPVILSFFYL